MVARALILILAAALAYAESGHEAFQRLSREAEALNHCESDADCVATGAENVQCAAGCGGSGIFVNRNEIGKFRALQEKAKHLKPDCPVNVCGGSPPRAPVPLEKRRGRCDAGKCAHPSQLAK